MRREIKVGLPRDCSGQEIMQAFESLDSSDLSEPMRFIITYEPNSAQRLFDFFSSSMPRDLLGKILLFHKIRRVVLRDTTPFMKLRVRTIEPTETYKQIAIVVHLWTGFTLPRKQGYRPFSREEQPYLMSLLGKFYDQLETSLNSS